MEETPTKTDSIFDNNVRPWGEGATFTISGTPEQQAALFAALAEAQGEFPQIPRSKTARIFGETKSGKKYDYTFDYAPLDAVLKAINPVLAKHGLALNFPPAHASGSYVVGAMLGHSGGGRMSTSILLDRAEDIKKQASSFTYMQRYCVCGLVGVYADTDDDAAAANDEQAAIKDRSKPQQRRQEKPKAQPRPERQEPPREPPPAKEPPPPEPKNAAPNAPMSQETEDKILTLAKALKLGNKGLSALVYELFEVTLEQIYDSEAMGETLVKRLEKDAEEQGVLK